MLKPHTRKCGYPVQGDPDEKHWLCLIMSGDRRKRQRERGPYHWVHSISLSFVPALLSIAGRGTAKTSAARKGRSRGPKRRLPALPHRVHHGARRYRQASSSAAMDVVGFQAMVYWEGCPFQEECWPGRCALLRCAFVCDVTTGRQFSNLSDGPTTCAMQLCRVFQIFPIPTACLGSWFDAIHRNLACRTASS